MSNHTIYPIQQALSLINSGAHYAKNPLNETLFALKTRILQQAIRRGAPIRYLYGSDAPSLFPWFVHPEIVEMEGGLYHWDLIEVRIGKSAFHTPVPFASRHGLLGDLHHRTITTAKRKNTPTGSKAVQHMPSKLKLGQAVQSAIEWMI